jgi:hypothetical protein
MKCIFFLENRNHRSYESQTSVAWEFLKKFGLLQENLQNNGTTLVINSVRSNMMIP